MDTIDMNGLRLEYSGGECVTVISEAPTIVRIDQLIADLISLRSQTLQGSGSCNYAPQSPDKRRSVPSQKAETV